MLPSSMIKKDKRTCSMQLTYEFPTSTTRIRPKSLGVKERDGKVQIDKIDYVEIRSLDLNPLNPLGINEKTCPIFTFIFTWLLAQA